MLSNLIFSNNTVNFDNFDNNTNTLTINNENDNIISYIPCSSSSFNVDEQSLLNGFAKPIYLSNRLDVIDEFVEYNSFSKLNMGDYQSSLFEIP